MDVGSGVEQLRDAISCRESKRVGAGRVLQQTHHCSGKGKGVVPDQEGVAVAQPKPLRPERRTHDRNAGLQVVDELDVDPRARDCRVDGH